MSRNHAAFAFLLVYTFIATRFMYAIEIEADNEIAYFVENETTSISCIVTHTDRRTINVFWSRNTAQTNHTWQAISSDDAFSMSTTPESNSFTINANLNIISPNRDSMGRYKCQTNHTDDHGETLLVMQQDAPVVFAYRDHDESQNTLVNLRCIANGRPELAIDWIKDGKSISRDFAHFNVSSRVLLKTYVYSAIISSLIFTSGPYYHGTYICNATNDRGYDAAEVVLDHFTHTQSDNEFPTQDNQPPAQIDNQSPTQSNQSPAQDNRHPAPIDNQSPTQSNQSPAQDNRPPAPIDNQSPTDSNQSPAQDNRPPAHIDNQSPTQNNQSPVQPKNNRFQEQPTTGRVSAHINTQATAQPAINHSSPISLSTLAFIIIGILVVIVIAVVVFLCKKSNSSYNPVNRTDNFTYR